MTALHHPQGETAFEIRVGAKQIASNMTPVQPCAGYKGKRLPAGSVSWIGLPLPCLA
jgi:hypothetical protein